MFTNHKNVHFPLFDRVEVYKKSLYHVFLLEKIFLHVISKSQVFKIAKKPQVLFICIIIRNYDFANWGKRVAITMVTILESAQN